MTPRLGAEGEGVLGNLIAYSPPSPLPWTQMSPRGVGSSQAIADFPWSHWGMTNLSSRSVHGLATPQGISG